MIYSANYSCDNVTLDRGSDTKAWSSCPDLSIRAPSPLSQSWHGQMTAGVKSQNVLTSHSFGDPFPPKDSDAKILKGRKSSVFSATAFLFSSHCKYCGKIPSFDLSLVKPWQFAFFGIISGPMQWTTFCPPIKYRLFSVSHKNSMEMRKWNGIFDYRI